MRSIILLLLVVFLVHLPGIRGEFVWDDRDTILEDQCPETPWWRLFIPAEFSRCAGELGYRPLVAISHDIDTAIWGTSPAGHHLTNILFHVLVVLLLIVFVRDLGYSVDAAVAGALIVSIHPLTVEPVSAISYRTDIMATFFFLLTILCARRALIIPGLLACLGALLCKETAVLLPFVVLVVTGRRRLPLVLIMTILAAAFVILRIGYYRSPAEAGVPFIGGSFRSAFINAPVMLFRAAGLFFYPRPCPDRSTISPAPEGIVIASWIGLVIIIIGLLYLSRGYRRAARWLGVVLILFLPFLGLYPLKMVLADRYLYAALIFAGIPLASLFQHLEGKWRYYLTGLIACGEIWITIMTQPMWWNDEILFRKTALCAPESDGARYNYGRSLVQLGRYGEAEGELEAALSLNPTHASARLVLGVAQFYDGRFDEAVHSYRLAEKIGGEDPRIAVNTARAFLGMGDTAQASAELERALGLDGDNPEAMALRDSILPNRNRFP